MQYILSETEFKHYRECRAEIIKLYNGFLELLKQEQYKKDSNIINRMQLYAKILNIKAGEQYEGI
jgi:hypothetical protein